MNRGWSVFSPSGSPSRIVMAYAMFGALWILFSDKLMVRIVPAGLQETVSIAKGWFFIAVTALLLHILIGRQMRRMAVVVEERTRELEEARLALMNNVKDLSHKSEEVAAANERLKEVDRFKSLFIASMSHELRTPLNSVIGFSSILLNEWIGTLNDEQKSGLTAILRSGKHLLLLINDVIDVSKVDAGMLEISSDDFDLAELLAELEQTFVQEVQDRGVVLTVNQLHLAMHTDRLRLLQCLLNLVSNAIKFTEQGGVTVDVRHDAEHGEVTFAVTDTGIGIREEDQPRLFQAFSRIYSPISSKVLGTGLGLYLSKKIISEILHGTISVSSEPGRGSTFAMTIPCRYEEGRTEQRLSNAAG